MAEFARGIVSRLRQFAGDRRHSKRQKVRLALSISVASPARSLNGTRKMSRMDGHTVDISANGMALIVPAIRIGEHHLVGENRNLNVNLELPVGPVEMQVTPVRYEALEGQEGGAGYLIAVKIVVMPVEDRAKYSEYFSTLLQRKR